METMTTLNMVTKSSIKRTPVTSTWETKTTRKEWVSSMISYKVSTKKAVEKEMKTKDSITKKMIKRTKISFSSKKWKLKCNNNSFMILILSFLRLLKRWVWTKKESESCNSKCTSSSKRLKMMKVLTKTMKPGSWPI